MENLIRQYLRKDISKLTFCVHILHFKWYSIIQNFKEIIPLDIQVPFQIKGENIKLLWFEVWTSYELKRESLKIL